MKKNELYFLLVCTFFLGTVVASILFGYNFGRYQQLDEIRERELVGQNAFSVFAPQISDYNIVFDRYILGSFWGQMRADKKYYSISFEDENNCITTIPTYGISMFPAIPYNSVMVVDKCYAPEKLKVGDIVWLDNRAHRVMNVSLKDKTITTKGDSTTELDEPSSFSDLHGKAIAIFDIYSDS